MNRATAAVVAAGVAGLAAAAALRPVDPPASASPPAPRFTEREARLILQHELGPPPPSPSNRHADDPRAAHLGQFLFFDARLSPSGTVSCATCHEPRRAFTDGLAVARGLGETDRNTPTIFNAAYQRWFFWDGRADSLWSQSLHPIEKPEEMGGDRAHVARLIHDDPELRAAYEAIFGPAPDLTDRARFPAHARPIPADPDHPHHRAWEAMRPEDRDAVTRVFVNVGKAIEAYERRLISDDSPFDRFLRDLRAGRAEESNAMSAAARRGLRLFIGEAGCRMCHSGPNFSDGEFHNTGVPPLGPETPADSGRYAGIDLLLADPFNAAGPFSDAPAESDARSRLERLARSPELWGQFKTPTLREVARTAPYMRQGQFRTLEEVVRFYVTREGAATIGHHEEPLLRPLDLSDREMADLVAFLRSLSGDSPDPSLLSRPPSPRPGR